MCSLCSAGSLVTLEPATIPAVSGRPRSSPADLRLQITCSGVVFGVRTACRVDWKRRRCHAHQAPTAIIKEKVSCLSCFQMQVTNVRIIRIRGGVPLLNPESASRLYCHLLRLVCLRGLTKFRFSESWLDDCKDGPGGSLSHRRLA
jgi:hypothetical protein